MLKVFEGALADDGVLDFPGGADGFLDAGDLPLFPALVAGVEFAEDKHQLVQQPHRKRPRSAGRVQRLQIVNGGNEGLDLGRAELVRFIGVGEEMAKTTLKVAARIVRAAW